MSTTTSDTDTGLERVTPDTHRSRAATHFRRTVAAVAQVDAAEQEPCDAVQASRDAGDSWTAIGAALGTSRQAAQQRFS